MLFGPDRRRLLTGAGALALAVPPRSARADNYPSRTIRIVVPLAPASTVDILARKFADALGERLRQPLIIDNKPGAGGVIGTGEVVRAPKDGYTLGMISSNHVINPGMIKSIPFDTLADVTAISVLGTVPIALVVHPSLPVKTVADVIALAKARPGQIDYGSAGTGSAIHLAGVLFAREAGIDIKHVPYRGSGPLANDLVAGHVKMGFLAVPAASAQIEGGLIRALAVSTPTRAPRLPDVPTMAEAGLPNYSFDAWIAIIGPKDLPRPLVDRLYGEVKAVLATDKMKAELDVQAITPVGSDPETATRFFATELDKHQRLVAASGAKAE